MRCRQQPRGRGERTDHSPLHADRPLNPADPQLLTGTIATMHAGGCMDDDRARTGGGIGAGVRAHPANAVPEAVTQLPPLRGRWWPVSAHLYRFRYHSPANRLGAVKGQA
jgi:hypothetical protein